MIDHLENLAVPDIRTKFRIRWARPTQWILLLLSEKSFSRWSRSDSDSSEKFGDAETVNPERSTLKSFLGLSARSGWTRTLESVCTYERVNFKLVHLIHKPCQGMDGLEAMSRGQMMTRCWLLMTPWVIYHSEKLSWEIIPMWCDLHRREEHEHKLNSWRSNVTWWCLKHKKTIIDRCIMAQRKPRRRIININQSWSLWSFSEKETEN
jgi:hypothetical protein